jgi:hypothetical protein
MTGLGPERTPVFTSRLPPVPPEAAHARDVLVSLSIAAVLCLAATIIALWPTDPHEKTPATSAVATVSTKDHFPPTPTQVAPAKAETSSPTRFTNPFDTSEVFEFPPGTPEDTARASVADVLLERARERRAQTVRLSSLIAGK